MAFPDNTTLLDTFTGTDLDPVNSTLWPDVLFPGDAKCIIYSNQASSPTDNTWAGLRYKDTAQNVDFYVDLAGLTGTQQLFLYVRISDPNTTSFNGYALDLQVAGGADTWKLKRFTDSTTITTIASGTTERGSKIGISMHGSTLKAWNYNGSWSEILSVTDTTYPDAGYFGFSIYDWDGLIDNPSGGEVVSGATAEPATVVLDLTVPAPTLVPGEVVIIPTPVILSLVVPQPTLVPGTAVVTPTPVVLGFSVPEPLIVPGAVTHGPNSVGLAFAVPEPTISLSGFATPSPVIVNLSVPSPTFLMGETVIVPHPVIFTFIPVGGSVSDGSVPSFTVSGFFFKRRRES